MAEEVYSGVEKREIIASTRVDRIRDTARSIARLRSEFITADHPSSPQGTSSEIDAHLGEHAPTILEKTRDLYRQYHKVARDWEAKMEDEARRVEGEKELRTQLDLEDLPISEIRFGPDFIGIIMPADAVNRYHTLVENRHGFTQSEADPGVWGFAGGLSLQNSQGERCPVFVASDLRDIFPENQERSLAVHERVIAHEGAHTTEQNYISRRRFEEDMRKQYVQQRAFMREQIAARGSDPTFRSAEGQRKFERYIVEDVQQYLTSSMNFLTDEVIVEAASGNFEQPELLIRKLVQQTNPSPFPGKEISYGQGTREYVSGMLEGLSILVDKGQLSREVYVEIALQIEQSMILFKEHNELLGQKYIALWNSLRDHPDATNEFVSSMYALPPGQQWKVEYFLHDDQKSALDAGRALRQRLRFPQIHSVREEDKEQVFTWMLAEKFRQLPDGKDLLAARTSSGEGLMIGIEGLDGALEQSLRTGDPINPHVLLDTITIVQEEFEPYQEMFGEKVPAIFIQLTQFAHSLGLYDAREVQKKVWEFYQEYISGEFRFEEIMQKQIRRYAQLHSFSKEQREDLEGIWGALYIGMPGLGEEDSQEEPLQITMGDSYLVIMDAIGETVH